MATRTMRTKDPGREQARRQAAAKRRKRARRRKIIAFSCLFLFTAALLVALSLTVLFKVDSIEVKGDSSHSAEEITALCGISVGDNLIRVNTTNGRDRILSEFQDVDEVVVDKQFPSKVVITVSAATPAWSVEKNGKYYLLSGKNRVLSISGEKTEGVILVSGLALSGDPKQGQFIEVDSTILTELYNAFAANELTGVLSVDITDPENLSFSYQDRLTVTLGDESQLSYKVKFSAHFIKNDFKEGESGKLEANTPGTVKFIPEEYAHRGQETTSGNGENSSSSTQEGVPSSGGSSSTSSSSGT